jgi:predicted transcriptional regulator
MTDPKPDPLTPAEWKVMRIAWQRGPCSARDVYLVAGRRYSMAPSTVKTHLRRLVDKGYLATTQVGNSFLYQPVRPALGSLFAAADRLLENALEGTTGPLLAYMVKKGQLSAGELDELRALLERKKQEDRDGEERK